MPTSRHSGAPGLTGAHCPKSSGRRSLRAPPSTAGSHRAATDALRHCQLRAATPRVRDMTITIPAFIMGPGRDRVRVRSELRAQDVSAVAKGDALALMVPSYFPLDDCVALATQLLGADCWTTYSAETGAEGIGTLGDSLFGCLGQEICEEYFAKGRDMWKLVRGVVFPRLFPADRVQLELDHAWPTGASLLHVDGQPGFYGLVRAFREGGAAMPHTDRADWDFPCAETRRLTAQLFKNVYLSKTREGGTLRLWDHQPERAEYDAKRYQPGHYALDPDKVGEPSVEIDVPVGCLLLANAFRIHEVTASKGNGVRLSVSGFVGYTDDETPLQLFS